MVNFPKLPLDPHHPVLAPRLRKHFRIKRNKLPMGLQSTHVTEVHPLTPISESNELFFSLFDLFEIVFGSDDSRA